MNLIPPIAMGLLTLNAASQTQQSLPSVPSVTPQVAEPQPWSMRYANHRRTGQSPVQGAALGQVVWRFDIGGVPSSFAVDAEGNVHVGVVFHEAFWSQEVYSYVLASDGSVAWRVKVAPYDWGIGQNVFSSPALTPRGGSIVPSARGELLKFAPGGDLRWTHGGGATASNHSSPLVRPDGTVLHFQAGQGLKSFTPAGSVQWTNTGIGGVFTSPALAPNGDMALGGLRSTQPHGFPALYYFNVDGTTRWSITTTFGAANTPIFTPDGIVICCTEGVTAYRPDGSVQWNRSFGQATPALSSDGRLHVIQDDQIMVLNVGDGSTLTTITAPGDVHDGMAIGNDGTVYATTTNGYACAWTSAGAPIFELHLCDTFTTGVAVGSDDCIIAGGTTDFTEHRIYCIR